MSSRSIHCVAHKLAGMLTVMAVMAACRLGWCYSSTHSRPPSICRPSQSQLEKSITNSSCCLRCCSGNTHSRPPSISGPLWRPAEINMTIYLCAARSKMVHLRLRGLISTAKGGTRATCFGEMSPTHHALAGFHLDNHLDLPGQGSSLQYCFLIDSPRQGLPRFWAF